MGMYGERSGGTTVTVKKATLLAALKKNREGHRDLFVRAQAGYRAQCITALDKMLGDAREGRPFRTTVNLVAPTDHTKEYDIHIQMLEMAEDEVLMISQTQFQHFVLDDWDWRPEFLSNSTQYT